MKPSPAVDSRSLSSWTAELADETRRHLAFSCYCSSCENAAAKPMVAADLPSTSAPGTTASGK
ncbi:MAG: hypothetical protein ACT4TC_23995 [Myxococcaceae bacterium]